MQSDPDAEPYWRDVGTLEAYWKANLDLASVVPELDMYDRNWDFLSFFGGKRFVPIATGFFCLVLAAIFGYVWPPVQHAIHAGGEWIVSAGALGSGIFGFINRLLIPTGLYTHCCT